MQQHTGKRAFLIALLILVAILGLGSRRFAPYLPGVVVAYTGDTAWALEVFLAIRLLFPGLATGRLAMLTLLISTLVEFGQLYHAGWLDTIRNTTFGHLALGSGFDPKDLACYTVGVGIGVVIDYVKLARKLDETPAQ